MMKVSVFLIIFGATFSVTTAFAQEPVRDWEVKIKKMVELRQEVEQTARELDMKLQEQKVERDTLLEQKADLLAKILREELRQGLLDEKIKKSQKIAISSSRLTTKDKALLLASTERLKNWVRDSLPIDQSNRLSELQRVQERVQAGEETFEALSLDLWTWVEAEIKSAKSHQYSQDEVQFQGQSVPAQIGRMGFYSQYAWLTSGEVLILKKSRQDNWAWEKIEQQQLAKGIRTWIEDLKNKKQAGFYPVPTQVSSEGV